METMWAPWRVGYILGAKPPPRDGECGCLFCDKPAAGDDRQQLIVARAPLCFVLLNLYPYNNGHLMVAPYRHAARLQDLSDEEIAQLMQVVRRLEPILTEHFHPDGFNGGINLGQVAGAGVADHVHFHLVPRWSGDTNFMPVLCDTKVIPQSLEAVFDLLHEPVQTALNSMDGAGSGGGTPRA